MAQRYQAAQLAAAPRAVSASSSQTTVGPETTVSGPGRFPAAARSRFSSGVQEPNRSRGTQAGIHPSLSSAATRTARGPMAAIQMGRSGTAGCPSRSGRAAGVAARGTRSPASSARTASVTSRSRSAGWRNGTSWNPSTSARVLGPSPRT